jgi:hypothetical protein
VEGDKVATNNPYLAVNQTCASSWTVGDHATAVAGLIASTHGIQQGLAPGARINSAACGGSDMTASRDWGASTANIQNNSYYETDDGSNAGLYANDRHLSYIVANRWDFVTKSAGNRGANSCQNAGDTATPYVTSPGKGYNTMTVGNFDQNGTLGWSDDAMDICSSFGNPSSDNGYTHDKPEVAASGASLNSTLTASPWVGGVGSGTSYAAPMVAGLAADIIQAAPSLSVWPETVRSIIMATALHNIEGAQRFSDKDGAGAIDGTAALKTVERQDYQSVSISASNFPMTYTLHAYAGERIRFVVNWVTRPAGNYASGEQLPADIDMSVYRVDTSTFITGSYSSGNNFEIVDFTAPATADYNFRLYVYSGYGFPGPNTSMGVAWWRGYARLAPDTGFTSSGATTPLGGQFAIYPNDWPSPNYWRIFGSRPISNTVNQNLELYNQSLFGDPGGRVEVDYSDYLGQEPDFILVDGNHRSASQPDFYRVFPTTAGTGNYDANWSNPGLVMLPNYCYNLPMTSGEVVMVADVYFLHNQALRLYAFDWNGQNDIGLALYRSDPATASTWVKWRGYYVKAADAYGAGYGVESMRYLNTGVGDYLGLAIYSKLHLPANVWVCSVPVAVNLPLVRR